MLKNITVNSYNVAGQILNNDIDIVDIPQFYGEFVITIGDKSKTIGASTNTSGPRCLLNFADFYFG